jgi:hypothetical protein
VREPAFAEVADMMFSPGAAVYFRRYALCVAVLAISLVLLPLVALAPEFVPFAPRLGPAVLRNALFFWPQYLLLPNGVAHASTGAVYMSGTAMYVMAAFWLAAVGLYVSVTRRVRLVWVAAALLPAVALTAEIVLRALMASGFRPLLDGL